MSASGNRIPLLRCALGFGLLVLAGCARPVGDLGRYDPDVLHDQWLPFLGNQAARQRHEPVSDFPYTDNETLLRNRAQALIDPPDLRDWDMATETEAQRTRLNWQNDQANDPNSYQKLLLSDSYVSSDTRYNRLIGDMQSDILQIAPFTVTARAVRTDDAARFAALNAPHPLKPDQLTNAYAREDENSKQIAWVWRAMRFRLKAYRLAIQQLAIATPSAPLAAAAQAEWSKLRDAIEAADLGTQPQDRLAMGARYQPAPVREQQDLDLGPYTK